MWRVISVSRDRDERTRKGWYIYPWWSGRDENPRPKTQVEIKTIKTLSNLLTHDHPPPWKPPRSNVKTLPAEHKYPSTQQFNNPFEWKKLNTPRLHLVRIGKRPASKEPFVLRFSHDHKLPQEHHRPSCTLLDRTEVEIEKEERKRSSSRIFVLL